MKGVEDQQVWGLQSVYPPPQGKLPVMLTKELSRRIGSLDAVVGLLAKLYLLYCEHPTARKTCDWREQVGLASGVGTPEFNRNPLLGVELFEDS